MSIRSHYHTLRYLALADAAVSATLWAGLVLWWHDRGVPIGVMGAGASVVVAVVTYAVAYSAFGQYAVRSSPTYDRVMRTVQSSLIALLPLAVMVYAVGWIRSLDALVPPLLAFGGVHLLLTLVVRRAVLGWRHHQLKAVHWRPLTLVVGGGERALQLLAELDTTPEALKPHLVGYLDAAKSPQGAYTEALQARLPRLGHVDDLGGVLLKRELDLILIAPDRLSHRQFLDTVRLSRPYGLSLMIPPDLFDFTVGSYRLTRVLSTPLIELRLRVSEPFEAVVKRVADAVLSALLLLLLLPLMLVIGLAVRLDSRGPAIYHQQRIGRRGRAFTLLKFRTMHADAEQGSPQLTQVHDPRVTRVGRWLRRHHLDELPQLWNVIVGDMSIVGPRPERAHYLEQIRAVAPEVDHVLQVRPGIIGWAQLANGYARTLDQMLTRLRYDLLYVQHQSWVLDVKIGLLSLRRVIVGEPD